MRVLETSSGLASDPEGKSFENPWLWVLWALAGWGGARTTQGRGMDLGQSQRGGLSCPQRGSVALVLYWKCGTGAEATRAGGGQGGQAVAHSEARHARGT